MRSPWTSKLPVLIACLGLFFIGWAHITTNIQGRSITTTPPTDGQTLVWDSATGMWVTGSVSATAGVNSLDSNTSALQFSGSSGNITGGIAIGNVSGTVAAGDDARLSDTRTPKAHVSTHAAAGSDPLSGLVNSQIDAAASITWSKLAATSGTDKVIGRSSSGAGALEEITCTAAGRAILDDASAADQRTTLGLGNVAVLNLGGNASAYLNGEGNFTVPPAGNITVNGNVCLVPGANITVNGATSPVTGTYFTLSASSTPPTTVVTSFRQNIGVPLYIYPGADWTTTESAVPAVGMIVANPNSGPGTSVEPNYYTYIKKMQKQGILVLGYVPSGYTQVPIATFKSNVDKWYQWYQPDGIFVDEGANDTGSATLTYYKEAYDYVKASSPRGLVCLNPGCETAEEYMSRADIIVTYEQAEANWATTEPPAWVHNYAPSRFWNMIHTADPAHSKSIRETAMRRNVGWIYVTDDVMPNPYDALPTFMVTDSAMMKTADAPAQLSSSGVVTGTYGSATESPVIAVDQWGRVTSASNTAIRAGGSLSLGIPLYIYPGTDWTTIGNLSDGVGFVVASPNSGPGAAPDANYVQYIKALQAKGVMVFGYVETSLTTVPLATVEADINKWYAWYKPDGIYVGTCTGTSGASELAYYASVYSYVKSQAPRALVTLGIGSNCAEEYTTRSDIILTYYNTYALYGATTPNTWTASYPASRFWQIIYNCSAAEAVTARTVAKGRNVGWIYCNDEAVNPLGVLPSYLATEAEYSRKIAPSTQLVSTGTTTGTYGSASSIPSVTVDQYGRVTGMSSSTVDSSSLTPTWNNVQSKPAWIAGNGDANTYLNGALSFSTPPAGGSGNVTLTGALDGVTINGGAGPVYNTVFTLGLGAHAAKHWPGGSDTLSDTFTVTTRAILAGTGLTGGGDLSIDRTLAVDSSAITPTWNNVQSKPSWVAGNSNTAEFLNGNLAFATPSVTLTAAGVAYVNGVQTAQNGSTFNVTTAAFGTASGTIAQGDDNRFNAAPGAAGSVPYDTGGSYSKLAPGSTGQFLKMAAPGTIGWADITSSVTLTGSGLVYVNGVQTAQNGATFNVTTAAVGTTAGTIAAGDDARLVRLDAVELSQDVYGFVETSSPTITFDTSTREVAVGNSSSPWIYCRTGKYDTVSTTKTANVAVAAGAYHIYTDADDGTLTASISGWTLNDTIVPIAEIIYNSSLTPKYWLVDERHTNKIMRRTHRYAHFSFGTQLTARGATANVTVTPSVPVDADNCPSIGASQIADEDLFITLPALAAGDGSTAHYVTWYRTASATWVWAKSAVPFKYGTYAQYDSNGTMTDATTGDFVNWYLCFTNVVGDARYIWIPGRSKWTTLAGAQAEDFGTFDLSGLQLDETVAVSQFTFELKSTYSSKGKARLAATPRSITKSLIAASGSSPTLGTMAYQNSSAVAITGGTMSGVIGLTGANGMTVNGSTAQQTGGTYTITPTYGSVAALAAADSNGSADSMARSDHAHKGVISALAGTGISVSGATGNVTITNSGVTSIAGLYGLNVSAATGSVNVSPTYSTSAAALAATSTGGTSQDFSRGNHAHAGPTVNASGTSATITTLNIIAGPGVNIQQDNSGGTMNVTVAAFGGMYNRIINGDFQINQRQTTNVTTCYNNVYNGPDRWLPVHSTDGVMRWQSYTDSSLPGFSANVSLSVSTADTSIGAAQTAGIFQRVEASNIADLGFGSSSASPITLDFWVKSSKTGTYAVVLSNTDFSRTCPLSYTVNSTSTWEHKTLSVTGDVTGTWATSTGSVGILCYWYLAMGSNYTSGADKTWTSVGSQFGVPIDNFMSTTGNQFNLTGVQLVKGRSSVPLAWNPRAYADEQRLCHRHFQVIGGTSAYEMAGYGNATNATDSTGIVTFNDMMAAPTITISSAGDWTTVEANSMRTCSSLFFGFISRNRCQYNSVCSTGLTAGHAQALRANNTTSARIYLSSEL